MDVDEAGQTGSQLTTPYALDTLQEIILGCAAQVAQQIRSAQQKAALQGQAPPAWAIGAKCQALDPLEATWQEATVKGISATGNFVLAFAGREDDLEEVLHAPTLCKQRLGNKTPTGHTAILQLVASELCYLFILWHKPALPALMAFAWAPGKEQILRSDAAIEFGM